MYMYMYTYIYICMYIDREREIDITCSRLFCRRRASHRNAPTLRVADR